MRVIPLTRLLRRARASNVLLQQNAQQRRLASTLVQEALSASRRGVIQQTHARSQQRSLQRCLCDVHQCMVSGGQDGQQAAHDLHLAVRLVH